MEGDDPRRNLVDLAASRGVSLAQLSGMIGRNPSYLQQFVKKGSPRKLEESDRRRLAAYFGVDEGRLGGVAAPDGGSGKILRGGWVDIPRLPLGASAGAGAFAVGEQPIGAFRFSRQWLREHGLDPGKLSAIAVEGDSMEPLLRDGDEILVDRTPRSPQDGVHVIRVDGAVLVKRLQRARPGVLVLRSDNLAYPPVEHDQRDVEVIGRVVWKSGRL